ncbi:MULTISPECIES: phage tail protein [Photorhabdus]|uniref:Tail collar domain n=2 Tax=Photorhabdus asymbiotica TaxID=291112 RepID=A0ABX9SQI4_9GAMM|nr:phage tail protein [Photorhabdus asymbiotica]RKS65734.1 tail collar domain [Photorhabdus asymbiotica]CAQ84379.1 similar to putative tail fiber protein [Photorhabdus asymbiotica]CAR66796.1 similar to putative tail fiber protein [Photorhabdus asymbiotica subsp. asymbiotica ATCC 43949]
MSQKNDFKAFSIKNGANVVSQYSYENSPELQTGLTPNSPVDIHLLNKALRQSSVISSVVADFIATQSGDDILDDGDIAKLTVQLNRALKQKVTAEIPSASLIQKGVVQLTNEMGNNDTLAVTQKLVQEIVNSLRENINGKVPNSRRINGKALTEDINLNASDVGAYTRTEVYTRAEVDKLIKTTSEIPVGSPIPWPLSHPPFGYVTCNGSAFSRSQYPKLAEAYPSGRLPDLRGEFIRGWDDGRGIDSGRALLTNQSDAIRNITGGFSARRMQGHLNIFRSTGCFGWKFDESYVIGTSQMSSVNYGTDDITFDASRVVPTANENRPRNIAFNYIVKAA